MQSFSTYQSLDQISIITFWKIAEEDKYQLMDLNYTPSKTYSEEDLLILKTAYLKLYDEYFLLKDSQNQRLTIKNNDEKLNKQHKIQLLESHLKALVLIDYLVSQGVDKSEEIKVIIDNIKRIEKRVNLPYTDSLFKIMEKVAKLIKRLVNQLEIDEARSDQHQKREAKKFKNYYDNIVAIEGILERPLGDDSLISAMKWIAYEKQAENKIKAQKNGSRKPRN